MAKANFYGYLLSCIIILTVAQFGVATVSQQLGGKKLIIGLPKRAGFTEFVDVKLSSSTNQLIQVTGYAIDIFNATVDYLSSHLGFNVSYEFQPFINGSGESAGSYDQLVEQVYKHKYDAVVGDVSIVASRSKHVDFTLPYTESGVMMLVRAGHHQQHLNMWFFMRPFSWDLWLTITITCFIIGATIRFMERNIDAEPEEGSPRRDQLKGISIIWLPLAQVVLPDRESVGKNCSKFVLVVWLIVAFVLVQSYTASLSSILTVDQLKPSYPSVNDLIRNGDYIGCPTGSFVYDMLVDLKFDKLKLKNISDIKGYKKALDDYGTKKGGVAVIFDEISFIKIFLKKYGSRYLMVGPHYRNDGFGFAFPVNSNLTSYFSRAILNVTQGDSMGNIERKYFGKSDDDAVQDKTEDLSSSDTPNLTTYSFAGLFIITGIVTVLALVVSESHIWREPVRLVKVYSKKLLRSPHSAKNGNNSVDDSATQGNEANSIPGSP